MGYPNETEDDLQENLKFFRKESKNIHYVCCIQKVVFAANSIMTNNKEVYEKLVNKNKEYKEIIDKFSIAIRNQVGEVVINCYWQYLYIINKGWLRYSLLKFLILNCSSSKKNIFKSLLEWYHSFLVHKTSIELSRVKGRVSE